MEHALGRITTVAVVDTPDLADARPASWVRLARYLPLLVGLTAAASIGEAVAGIVFDEPVLAASAALSAAFGGAVVLAALLIRLGHLRWVPVLMATAVYLLGVVAAALLPGVESGSALLPILSVVLLLPGQGRRATLGIVALALAGSALVFVLAGLPHPFPSLREPLRSIFPAAIILGIALLILGMLADFANEARESIESMRRSVDRHQAGLTERMAVIASLSKLEQQDTAEATAAVIADALAMLPGIHVAAVFGRTSRGLEALAVVGSTSLPTQKGDVIPERRAGELLRRVIQGPWAERWVPDETYGEYGRRYTEAGIRGQAFGPILLGGEVLGIVAIGTTDEAYARHFVSELPAVGEFAATASLLLAPQLIALRELGRSRDSVDAIIYAAAFRPVFQPVVDLAIGDTVGFEALTRFADGRPPDAVFHDATMTGRGLDLEAVTLAAAVRDATRLPAGAWLSLNVSPALVLDHDRLAVVLADHRRPVVLEITEHVPIGDYRAVRDGVAALGPNVRLAVDDAGAGIANFAHIVELHPDVIKIDISLIRDIDTDLTRQALVVGLVHFAMEIGSEVIAEGIETEAERATVQGLGVQLGQGYLSGRPTSIELIVPGDAAVPSAA